MGKNGCSCRYGLVRVRFEPGRNRHKYAGAAAGGRRYGRAANNRVPAGREKPVIAAARMEKSRAPGGQTGFFTLEKPPHALGSVYPERGLPFAFPLRIPAQCSKPEKWRSLAEKRAVIANQPPDWFAMTALFRQTRAEHNNQRPLTGRNPRIRLSAFIKRP